MRSFLIALTRNPISLLGTAVTTASAVLIIILFAIELFGFLGNPYIGILAYLVLPGIFLAGLILIPIGVARERRRARRARAEGEPPAKFPVIDLNRDTTRRWVLIFVALTAMNIVILAVATYKGVEVMESTEFCGVTCHSVMAPEHTAYVRSPHARVKCVDCHIGPGADWFVKSKLSGAWQVVATTLELYPRPIPTPIHDLRPARETCEQCHWPTKFVGDQLKVITHYEEDEASTEVKTVLLLRVGGIQGRTSHGIHWHVDPNIRVRYRSDEARQTIYDVELTDGDGTVKVYKKGEPPEADGDVPEDGGWRTMDCVDCHNRPTHIYGTPEQEIDEAIRQGRISRSLPYVRREGLEALRQTYDSHEHAREGILSALSTYYGEHHADVPSAAVEAAGNVLADIYAVNVFPSMSVTWGTYPNFIGHQYYDGCFRCHDDEHSTDDGEVISQDCFTCHSLLAMEEEAPEILEELQP
jgi:hypothetical protein